MRLLFVHFFKPFDFRLRKDGANCSCGLPSEIVNAIMMPYKNTNAIVRPPNGDTNFFDKVSGVLKKDLLALCQFIVCQDYIL